MRHSAKLLAFSCVLLSSAAYGAGSTAPGIVQGNNTAVAGHCWQVSAAGVAIDSGATCGTGASGVSQSTGTASQVLVNGDTASHTGATTYSLPAAVSLGTPGSAAGSLGLAGATSGTATVASPATGGGTLTLPAGTDTLVGRATTDTLTNKSVSGSANTITNIPLTTAVTGVLPVANGGSGTSTPGIVAGTNVTVTGSWPNQTVNSSGGGGGGTPGGVPGTVQWNSAGTFAGVGPGTLDDILHGGAAGPTFAPVNLSTVQVTGILGAANGGAGSTVGILKANGAGAVSQAVSGSDYAPPTSGGAILYGDTFGGFNSVTVGSGLDFTSGTLSATGGSVSLSSGSSNIVVNPNPITGTGTITASFPVNAQTGTTYALVAADGGKLVTLSNASAVAVSLPQAGSTGFTTGWSVTVQNKGAGTVTITPATSTINGGATLAIATNTGCDITSDGTNYQVSACTAISAGTGTVTSVGMTGDGTVFNASVTGSPVTTSGTLAPSLHTQTINTVLAGPTSGGAVAPTFRALVSGDIPAIPVSTGLSGLGTGVATALGTAVTGSGGIALATNPIFTTPNLGTPSVVNLGNGTNLPVSTGVSGLGTGVATALSIAHDTTGGICTVGGAGCAGGGSVTWPTTADLVISNGTSSPAGLAPVNGDCVLAAAGAWTAGSCAGSAAVTSVSDDGNGTLIVTPTTGAVTVALNLASGNTWTVAQAISAAGALSSPGVAFYGTLFTGGSGTSTRPYFAIGDGASNVTTWSTSGTYEGYNAKSAFAGNFVDMHLNGGASLFKVASSGAVTSAAAMAATGYQVTGSGSPNTGINAPATTALGLWSNNVERMRFDSSGNPYLISIASATTAQTGTVCILTTSTPSGELTYDPTNTCLSSLEELKDNHGSIGSASALVETMKLNPFWGTWKHDAPSWIGGDHAVQPFLGAHGVEAIDPRLASYDSKGKLRSVRYQEMVAFLVADVQGLQEEIAALFVLILGLVGWNIYLTRKVMS